MAREPAHVQELRCALGRALTACRQEARWSQAKLADKLHYHRSAISHLEAGRHPAPRDFWKHADELLNADGALLAAYEALFTAKRDATEVNQRPQRSTDDGTGLTEAQPSANSGVTGRRTALKLSLAAAVAPEMLNRVLSDAAAEAMEFTRLTGVSSVGHGMLEHLELVLSDLNQGYSREEPA
ncbi:MAG: helix-turn-helix domain-containing protein, partial [Pseudonocardiaceae bacterium]